jgi:hypothetical protein
MRGWEREKDMRRGMRIAWAHLERYRYMKGYIFRYMY